MGDIATLAETDLGKLFLDQPERFQEAVDKATPDDLPVLLSGTDIPSLFLNEDAMTAVLDATREIAERHVPDLSTVAGRAKVRSLAASIMRSKTAFDDVRLALTEGWRNQTKAVNAVGKRVELFYGTLATDVRQPLTDWEAADERRKVALQARLRQLEPRGATTSAEIKAEIDRIEAITIGADWDEFQKDADRAKDQALAVLRDRYLIKVENERLAAENARLAEEKAERDRIAAEQQEKADAEAKRVEAEKQEAEATRRAEEKAKEEAERKRVADEEARQREAREAEEREARAAEQARREAEERAQEEARRKEREAAEAVAAAERRAQEAQAERDAAAQAEASRVAREQRERDERLAREADEAHRETVISTTAAEFLSIIEGRTPEAAARACAEACADGSLSFASLRF